MYHIQFQLPLLLLGFWALHGCLSWTTTTTTTTTRPRSLVVLRDAAEGERDELKRRMALVRSLQSSYYDNFTTHSTLDPPTGTIVQLPLWRVGWTELPGRSNMLNVHEPMYTHMFESLIRDQKPWYLGHLYLPKGGETRKRSDANDGAFRLKTWNQEIENSDPRSTVVGTLMRIADYRRMEDGRLLLLVEALERFVVTRVRQELPYPVADVQLVPDTEEVDPNHWVDRCTEGDIRDARSLALADSFQRYHPYEFDETFQLPIPQKKDLQVQDIHGSLLTLVLPYVPLSKTADLSQLNSKALHFDVTGGANDQEPGPIIEIDMEQDNSQPTLVPDEQPCLERQLLQGNVLQDFVHPDDAVVRLSLGELECRVWIEINTFLKATKTPVSPVLLGLLPEGIQWPSNFYLRKIANGIASRTDLKHNFVQVSPLLPCHRRQRRLSYSATTLLENKPGMEGLKQELLETASTKARLSLILNKLEEYNAAVWGEFE